MIKFFRHIRQNLIMENKNSKYLKYAIGEIVLVMVGILLALQINNWNEQKKSDIFELKMLKEIKNAIENDITYLQSILDYRIKIIDTGSIALAKMLKQDKIDSTKFNTYALSINLGYVFQYNNGAYEALKASGIDKVSNDSLRNKLIHFYDFVGPRTKQLIEYNSNDNLHQLLNDLKWQIFEYDVKSENDNAWIHPIRYKLDNYHDERFLRFLDLKGGEAFNGKRRIGNYIHDSKEVLALLDKELNQRTHD